MNFTGCSSVSSTAEAVPAPSQDGVAALLAPWPGPYGGVPPFDRFRPADLRPALEQAMAEGLREIDRIADDPAPPSFRNTIEALEGAGRTLWDFPDAPWEFKMNMARQCWDEARHVQIYEKLLAHVGGYVGMFPESTFLFEAACADDPVLRVAGVNRGLEGLACDVFRDMIKYAEKTGNDVMRQAVDYVLADELTHVRFGSEWVHEFTKDDPERAKRAKEFQLAVDKKFSIGGTRSGREDASIPVAVADRREAGFTDAEIEELYQVSAEGPTRQTLRKASAILRERHLARKGTTAGAAA